MRHLRQHFRLRPSLLAGALCILLSSSASAADFSPLPAVPALTVLLHINGAAAGVLCEAPVDLHKVLVAVRAKDDSGFIPVDEFEFSAATGKTELATGPTPAGPAPLAAAAVGAPAKPSKLSYIAHLPQELAEKAKALSSHIVAKFKVEPHKADYVVASAMQTSVKTGLPASLVLAVIAVESSFNETAKNGNARGLMQIIPFWHKDKVKAIGGPEELMKPEKNIATGAEILREYIDRTGSVFKGLYRYNASPHAKQYSEKVLKEKNGFEQALVTTP